MIEFHTHKKKEKKNLNGLILHWSLLLGRLLSEATDSEVSVVPTVSCMSGKQLCWSYQHLFTGSGDALLWAGIKRIQRNKQALSCLYYSLAHWPIPVYTVVQRETGGKAEGMKRKQQFTISLGSQGHFWQQKSST